RVLRFRHPLGQRFAGVAAGQIQRWPVENMHWYHSAKDRNLRLPPTGMKHQFTARFERLALQSIEETGQAVEIVLRPALVGMMMALGTFQTDAQECLADRAG